ncbi:MAG: hypothetical protein VYE68_16530 [Acidobacteriota bacterium]|nr:hypothetical protein [Acidobacteriota bacterium]
MRTRPAAEWPRHLSQLCLVKNPDDRPPEAESSGGLYSAARSPSLVIERSGGLVDGAAYATG